MHPETKKLTEKKHALSNTDRKPKATTKPRRATVLIIFVVHCDISQF